jgi:predicted transcriptional regulator
MDDIINSTGDYSMVAIELDASRQERLDVLARERGESVSDCARQILSDYLDFQALPKDSEEAWAEASVALAAEVMEPDDWKDAEHGSR